MATATGRTRCIKCDKDRATMKCGGCCQDFCYRHLADHRQDLNKQFDDIEVSRDVFRQLLTEQIQQPNNNILIEQINKWKEDSIKIIHQTAEEAIKIVLENTEECIKHIEKKLNKLTNQLRESREEDDFNEINLGMFQDQLTKLTEELTKPCNIIIQEDSTSFISRISVHLSNNINTFQAEESTLRSNTCRKKMWKQNGITIAGGNGSGNRLHQLRGPFSIYINNDGESIYITDYNNDRIVEWKFGATKGKIVAGGNGKGNEAHQLNCPTNVILDKEKNYFIISDCFNKRVVRWPRRNGTSGGSIILDIEGGGLAIDSYGNLYVSDRERNEVRRWVIGDNHGKLVAGGNGKGDGLHQLDWPTSIFVDDECSVYISDSCNHRVIKWRVDAHEGVVVAGGHGEGKDLTQLADPRGLFVDHLGTIFIADRDNHRIMCWPKEAKEGSILVGGNGRGDEDNKLNNPINISFDLQGNLYVADFENHRVQKFNMITPM